MRRWLIVITLITSSLFLARPAAACPQESIMLAGGAPGYPDVCLSLVYFRFFPW